MSLGLHAWEEGRRKGTFRRPGPSRRPARPPAQPALTCVPSPLPSRCAQVLCVKPVDPQAASPAQLVHFFNQAGGEGGAHRVVRRAERAVRSAVRSPSSPAARPPCGAAQLAALPRTGTPRLPPRPAGVCVPRFVLPPDLEAPEGWGGVRKAAGEFVQLAWQYHRVMQAVWALHCPYLSRRAVRWGCHCCSALRSHQRIPSGNCKT